MLLSPPSLPLLTSFRFLPLRGPAAPIGGPALSASRPGGVGGGAMETELSGGEQSDDGGATPVQDEHESASDMEDNGNEQHSGSENGSIGQHSENELSDGEDDRHPRENPATDSEDEDTPRQKHSDSENEEAPNHQASDSENEGAPQGKDSDSENEDCPVHQASDSENEDRPVHQASDSENEDAVINNQASDSETEEPLKSHESDSENEGPQKPLGSDSENESSPKGHTSDLEHEESRKHPGSDSENEEPGKNNDSDSENETAPKPLASDSENEGPKAQASDSDAEESPRDKPKIELHNENGENQKEEEMENGPHLSDNEQPRKRLHGSDSEEEEELPKRRKIVDSDEEEEEENKAEEMVAKRRATVLSDSDDDVKTPPKKGRIISDGEESDSDVATEKPKKPLVSDSEDDENKADDAKKKEEKDLFGSDSESGNEQENLIADIFGESGDEEEEEFTGFNQEDLEEEKIERKETADDSDSDDSNIKRGKLMDFMSDFDMMLQRKKCMSGKRRRNRDGGTFISDADDVVSAMIVKMNEAAEEDRQLNTQKKPALKKLTLLPTVVMHLKKQDLKETFIDSGVMSAIKEWLSPLPDRSLPALKIRDELLKILQELPSVSQETLKHSGIGRAVMYLYKHPKESRPNKDMAGKLINEWSRPIFGLTSNYKGMTREEREQRDLEQMPQRRRLSSSGGQTPRRDLDKVLTGEEKALRPGDPGFCARARVPMPSNKDYVVRPKWNVEMESSRFQGGSKKGVSRLDKQMRKFTDIRKKSKTSHAVKISIEGNKMPL